MTTDNTNAARQAALVARRREAGLVRVRVWVPAGYEHDIREHAERLCNSACDRTIKREKSGTP
jgi:hypothetical protein